MDYLASEALNAAKCCWLVDQLNDAAKARTQIDVEVDKTTVVASASDNALSTITSRQVLGKHTFDVVRRGPEKPWPRCICCKVNIQTVQSAP
jgi:hypothetical protein